MAREVAVFGEKGRLSFFFGRRLDDYLKPLVFAERALVQRIGTSLEPLDYRFVEFLPVIFRSQEHAVNQTIVFLGTRHLNTGCCQPL